FAPSPVPVAVAYELAIGSSPAPGEAVDSPPATACKSVAVEVFALPEVPAVDSIELHLERIVAREGSPFHAASSLPPGTRWACPPHGLDAARSVGAATGVAAPQLRTV